MAFGNPSLGLGEYLTLWAIIAVGLFAFAGWILGAAGLSAVFFFLGVSVVVLFAYIIISRGWRLALHGSIRAGGKESDRDGNSRGGSGRDR